MEPDKETSITLEWEGIQLQHISQTTNLYNKLL